MRGDTKLFDRVARKWNVDYAFYQTEPGKYLLFFKSGQADAMTACFSEYSRKVLDKAKSRQPTIPEQMKQAEQQLAKEKPPKENRAPAKSQDFVGRGETMLMCHKVTHKKLIDNSPLFRKNFKVEFHGSHTNCVASFA